MPIERVVQHKIPQPPATEDSWKTGAVALLATMTPAGQQACLASWAKIKEKAGGAFCPELPAPPPVKGTPAEVGLLRDFTVLDLEFTPPAHLLELAAIRYQDWQEVGRYAMLVQYQGAIHWRVTDVTGITEAQVRHLRPGKVETAKTVLQRFLALAEDSVLVAHNAVAADKRVLEATRRTLGKTDDLPNKWLCTLALAKHRLPKDTPCGLGQLCQRFGIASHDAHRALRDVEMCYQVLRHFHCQQPITELVTSSAKPKAAGTGNLFAPAP